MQRVSCGRESSSLKSDPGSLAPDRCETFRRAGLESVCVFGHDAVQFFTLHGLFFHASKTQLRHFRFKFFF